MTIRVAINGFGRIGRMVLRAAYEQGRKDIEFVAINDLADIETNAFLLKHDSAHGAFPGTVNATNGALDLGNGPIKCFSEPDPAKLPWKDLDVDVALECSGHFASRDAAAKHLQAGAKKVLVSAPAKGADITIVMGVNEDKLEAGHEVVSNASCTTNCLAPMAKVLHEAIGIERGFMTTVHAFTGDQRLVDTMHKDPRRARAAAHNIIPTSTGAARAVGLVLPELAGKLDGTAIRVPTLNVSLIDFKFDARNATTVEKVNEALLAAAKSNRMNGILGISNEPLVSSDFNHNSNSSTIDISETQVIDDKLVRVMSWYDNEWGFSNRMCDAAVAVGKTI
ncbi:type I glyceraldehyde-3-phosphate dehydrogenase [Ferruginivarius sediminum]|uniref:Glyceraldehyde-3-phosphate dehydrogenase n=1 Tax=Ferruginivarius sediminum TaxID=2661937 RepID=A0A369TAG1_9PROT|nr:type I glyceraldehyde-3-phosphate dehydrogenase [Ferruginivarius sediminum]RDD61852.1 type I glyceraldehyde-3-phosphate dehydrogenase [Ferruginivarius sediminum]